MEGRPAGGLGGAQAGGFPMREVSSSPPLAPHDAGRGERGDGGGGRGGGEARRWDRGRS